MHYIRLVKADLRKPLEYGFVLSILLLYRVGVQVAERRKRVLARARTSAEVAEA